MISLGRPLRGISLRGIESGFDRVEGALPAPEEPAGERQVFDKVARFGRFGRVFFEQVVQERIEVFLARAGDDQFFGGAAMRQGVAAGDFLAGVRDRPSVWMEFSHTCGSLAREACGRGCDSHVSY